MTQPLPLAVCIPLGRAAYCLDCDVVFRLPHESEGGGACPACGGVGWAMVAKWLERRPDTVPEGVPLPRGGMRARGGGPHRKYGRKWAAGRWRFVPMDVYYL